jgi:hypothetical protein
MTPAPGRFHRFRDLWRARRDGRRDGRRGIPTSHEPSHPPALSQIAHRAHEALAELAKLVAADGAKRRHELDIAEGGMSDAEFDLEQASQTVATVQQRRGHADSFTAKTADDRGPRVSRRTYMAAIVAIVIAEFPLNAIAFRLFGEAEVITCVMTASLAVTLVLCAHGLGSFLRQPNPTMAERRWVYILIALPVLTIVAIAVIRARYLSVSAELTGLDTLGPVVGSAAFLIINLLVYTGATMLSYLAHAPSDRERKELVAAQQELKAATRRARSFQLTASRLGGASEESLQVMRARAERVIAYHRGLMTAYCTANLRARGNPEVPASLRELPTIEVPEVFRELTLVDPAQAADVRELPRAVGSER